MYLDHSVVVARWPKTGPVAENWGDKLNPILISHLSQLPVAHVKDIVHWDDRPVFLVIGSGLSSVTANNINWGMGFISSQDTISNHPEKICAVRGPRSREKFLQLGFECPEIYGDPAVLYSLFYWPTIQKKYDFGIIQHFREVGHVEPPHLPEGTSTISINVRGNIKQFVDQVLSCKTIISSSLHGIICAHSYNVPAYWLKASDLPLGDDFKFLDYYASIGYDDVKPARVENGFFNPGDCPILPVASRISIEKLLYSCPFMANKRKKHLFQAYRKLVMAGKSSPIFSETVNARSSMRPQPSSHPGYALG